jgi:CheY-like chemotaxis protein
MMCAASQSSGAEPPYFDTEETACLSVKERILLVDDDRNFLVIMGAYLQMLGYAVETADDGNHALERLLNDGPFDLVISDVYMPGLNGIELHAAMRSMLAFEAIPFLFISGHADPSTLSSVVFSPNDMFLTKSNEPDRFREWIAYLLTPVERRGMHPAEDRSSSLRRSEFRSASSGFYDSRR